jgi:hypothetical protein
MQGGPICSKFVFRIKQRGQGLVPRVRIVAMSVLQEHCQDQDHGIWHFGDLLFWIVSRVGKNPRKEHAINTVSAADSHAMMHGFNQIITQ